MTAFVKPDLPGTSINFIGDQIQSVAPSFADVVGIPNVFNWGPVGIPTLCSSFAEYELLFGTSASAGRNAVLSAFNGGGVPGEGGAGGVVVERLAGSAKAKATHAFNNTTPAAALTLTAKYEGTDGNAITVTFDDDPAIGGNDRCRIYFNSAKVGEYSYPQTNIANLVAQINATSAYVVASAPTIDGVAMAAVSGVALTTGNSGLTLSNQNWLDALASLEYEEFSILAYDGVDDTTRATIVSWVQGMAAAFRPVMLVVGGDTGDTASTAISRSSGIADEHVVNLGVGTFTDDLLGSTVSTAQLAPRIAGILAARGQTSALTYSKLGGLHSVGSPADNATLKTLRDGGVTALRRASVADADLVVSQGVTTFTSKVTTGKPYAVFSEPRKVRVHDIFIRSMKEWADEHIVGDVTVTDSSRAAVRSEGTGLINALLDSGVILPANNGVVPPIPAPFIRTPVTGDPLLNDAIPFEFGWVHADTANFVIGNGRVR